MKLFFTCSVEECKRPFRSRFENVPYCVTHYRRMERKGTLSVRQKKSIKKEDRDRLGLYLVTSRFGGLRDVVLKRDEYQCISCGMSQDAHKERWGRGLTVDHIDGRGRDNPNPNNILENLQTLCLSCHGKKDIKRRRPFSEFPQSSKEKILKNLHIPQRKEVYN